MQLTIPEALKALDTLRTIFDLYRIGLPDESRTVPGAVVVDSEKLNALRVLVEFATHTHEAVETLREIHRGYLIVAKAKSKDTEKTLNSQLFAALASLGTHSLTRELEGQ